MSARRFHHPPRLHLADAPGAEGLEPIRFGIDIRRFDIEVHAAVVIDLLDLDGQIAWRAVETLVDGTARAGACEAERGRPEGRAAFEVGGLRVDDESCQSAAMHPR